MYWKTMVMMSSMWSGWHQPHTVDPTHPMPFPTTIPSPSVDSSSRTPKTANPLVLYSKPITLQRDQLLKTQTPTSVTPAMSSLTHPFRFSRDSSEPSPSWPIKCANRLLHPTVATRSASATTRRKGMLPGGFSPVVLVGGRHGPNKPQRPNVFHGNQLVHFLHSVHIWPRSAINNTCTQTLAFS